MSSQPKDTYYINVFLNEKTKSTFISEVCEPLISESEARDEAIHYELDLGYPYVCTLTNGAPVSFEQDIRDEEDYRQEEARNDRRYGSYEEQKWRTYMGMIGI